MDSINAIQLTDDERTHVSRIAHAVEALRQNALATPWLAMGLEEIEKGLMVIQIGPLMSEGA